ncbi:MAG TPA: arginase [Bdellovibrionales bacterium]|nr:MAG: hypothetical protein A2X97_06570 [Bdellovibrionales bacterium GWA1_52_35]HAR42594.1 arginase [Bdellovibrionales bacterium]HCM40845.1 arginase [Bdellovibrionales bacterium]
MTKKFDPNAASASDSGIFGLPFTETESQLVLIPVSWEATTSYGGGTSQGPAAILEASRQVDLFDLDLPRAYEAGIFMRPESRELRTLNRRARQAAEKIIAVGGDIPRGNKKLLAAQKLVNEAGVRLNEFVYRETKQLLSQDKIVGIVGGDHSVPFGALRAVAEQHQSFGILHFDAHSDTRRAFEGFTWSHASIMYNVLEKIPEVTKLVQIGIRDYCEEEFEYTRKQKDRVKIFLDRDLSRRKFEGTAWWDIGRDVLYALPEEVWISFDIDGLDPQFCPHTGTPVPGGLSYSEASHILWMLVHAGKKIIGFDLNEVAPNLKNRADEWDANVGARLLYKLSLLTLASRGFANLQV